MRKKITIAMAAMLMVFANSAWADFSIGVNAPRGKLNAMKRWTAYAEYLSKRTGERVSIVPFSPSEVISNANEVDFMLANPTQSVVLLEEKHAKTLATLNGKYGPHFAGVIVAKKGNGISKAADLKGKSVMSMKFRQAAGGYLFQTYHLMQKGINPHKDFGSFKEGRKQDDLVLAVKSGLIDAAFVRTGILENMQKEGRINISNFVIVDQRTDKGFGLLHTTVLYPEWYLMAMHKTKRALVASVKSASLKLKPSDEASKKARIRGMVKPVSIAGMQAAMKKLAIRPYNK